MKPGIEISALPSLLQTLVRHKILVTYASAVYNARSVEMSAAEEVAKVQTVFASFESRSLDISSETDVRDLVAAKKIVNLQLERAKPCMPTGVWQTVLHCHTGMKWRTVLLWMWVWRTKLNRKTAMLPCDSGPYCNGSVHGRLNCIAFCPAAM